MTVSSNTANSSTALTLCPVNRTRHLCSYTIMPLVFSLQSLFSLHFLFCFVPLRYKVNAQAPQLCKEPKDRTGQRGREVGQLGTKAQKGSSNEAGKASYHVRMMPLLQSTEVGQQEGDGRR